MEQKKELKKNLGVFSAIAVVVGCVIGAGVFFKPYAIYSATGGAPGIGMLVWIIGGLASLLGALTFAEVAVMIPKTGGMVSYLTEAYNDKIGFLSGWMQIIIFFPAYIAGYGTRVGEELASLFGIPQGYVFPIAMALIIGLVILNSLGNKAGGGFQIVSTVCKLIPLIVLMIFGFALGSGDNPIFTPMVNEGNGVTAGSALGSGLIAVLFAFEGWTNVGAIAGEMKRPGRDLPIAIVGGVSIIMAVYFIINMAYLWVIPAEELATLSSPAAAVAKALFGEVGGTIIQVGIIISVIGAANGFLMSGSRVAFFLADTKTIPGSNTIAKVNKFAVPQNALILVATISGIYAFLGQFNIFEGAAWFDVMTDLGTFGCWIFYTLTFMCVMTLRKKMPNAERKYKVPLYPVVPVLAILGGLYVIVSQLFLTGTNATIMSVFSVVVTLLGLPVYIFSKKYYSKKQG